MLSGAGIDAVSSAQSRRVGTGVECGGTGLVGGSTKGWGCKTAAGGGSGMLAVVRYGGDGETARFGGFWGELGCWESFQGCSDGSPGVFCHSSAVVGGAEQGRASGHTVVDKYVVNDVVVHIGA